MVKKADVVVENFRPDVKKRLGIDYKTLAKINPRIVYASISGFGQDGPYADRPGFDQIAQGMGGLMSITGLPGQGPVRVGIPIADLTAGLFAAHRHPGRAARAREIGRRARHVATSLLQAQIFMLDFQAARYLVEGEVAKQAGNNHPTSIPTGVFKTNDGHINIAATGQRIWERFCEAAGSDRAAAESRLSNRRGALEESRRAQRRDRRADLSDRTSAEWVERFNEAGVPCGPIYSIDQMFADPQVKHLGIAQTRDQEGQEQDAAGRPAGDAVAHAVAAGGAAAGARRAYRRGAQGIRLQQARHRRAAQGQSGVRCFIVMPATAASETQLDRAHMI